jgi:hypothetical protein
LSLTRFRNATSLAGIILVLPVLEPVQLSTFALWCIPLLAVVLLSNRREFTLKISNPACGVRFRALRRYRVLSVADADVGWVCRCGKVGGEMLMIFRCTGLLGKFELKSMVKIHLQEQAEIVGCCR